MLAFVSARSSAAAAASLRSGRRSFATLLGAPAALPANTQTARGFEATGVRCGIKKKPDVFDFCLIRSSAPCTAAAVFTLNQFCAAPVVVSKKVLAEHAREVGGVVINAGCANACTGDKGMEDANTMVKLAEEKANIPNALVMSTGVIGPFLPMDKIAAGFSSAVSALSEAGSSSSGVDGWSRASRAIMTTDTQPKCLHRTLSIEGKEYTLSGLCKGAGMIHPNMATMLGVVAADLSVSPECLQVALKYAADRSFNSISIDGDTSTNDTLCVLANGLAPAWSNGAKGQYGISSVSSPAFQQFQAQLTEFCIALAQMIVQDGEGVTKFVEVLVSGGRSYAECKVIANSVSRSMLVKTALFGQDANWGRILAAVGYAGVPLDTSKVNLYIRPTSAPLTGSPAATASAETAKMGQLHLVKAGQPFDCNEKHASALFRESAIVLHLDLGLGDAQATVWTCDLSLDYVKINADYRS